MAEAESGDLELTRKRLTEWLGARRPGARNLEIEGLTKPTGSGFSNETLLCALSYDEAGKRQRDRLVIRLQPTGYTTFPFYDLAKQYEVMRVLGEKTDIPVPPLHGREDDPGVLGRPFYVMGHVDGEIPADNPPYTVEGFVCDAKPAEQRRLCTSGMDVLGRIAKLDWRSIGLDFVDWPRRDASPIGQHLDYYEKYLEWARCGRAHPTTDHALDWLRRNMPRDEPAALSWGDARIGNMIFRDFTPVAVLDWEMVTIGSPEVDLGWWFLLEEFSARGGGMPGWDRPRLAGFPSVEEEIAQWESIVGRKAQHLHYYKIFAGFRFAVIMIRLMQQQVVVGRFPEELGLVLERNNPVTQILAEYLELPPPQ